MTTKTLRKLTTQATIAFVAIIFFSYAIYREVKVLYTDISKAQILQRQGSPNSVINGITLLWFVIFAATLYAILKYVACFFIKIQKIREVKSALAERERQIKSEIEMKKEIRRREELKRKEFESPTLRYLLVQELKEKYHQRVKMTKEQWEEIEEDTECLDYDELCDLISKFDVTW